MLVSNVLGNCGRKFSPNCLLHKLPVAGNMVSLWTLYRLLSQMGKLSKPALKSSLDGGATSSLTCETIANCQSVKPYQLWKHCRSTNFKKTCVRVTRALASEGEGYGTVLRLRNSVSSFLARHRSLFVCGYFLLWEAEQFVWRHHAVVVG